MTLIFNVTIFLYMCDGLRIFMNCMPYLTTQLNFITKMKTALLFSAFCFLISCNQSSQPSMTPNDLVVIKKAQAQNTIEGTLKASMEYDFQFSDQVQLTDKAQFASKHKDEILKSIQVVEKATIPGKDFILVFYKYSVGADVAHETIYMKQIDGKWYVHSGYYASYDEDPFKNGNGTEGKALLEKADKWKKDDDNIWWK